MPKVSSGRIAGLEGMRSFTASELEGLAAQLDAEALSGRSQNNSNWLRRWARKLRQLAHAKERAALSKRLARKALDNE